MDEAEHKLTGKRILVVEDEFFLADDLSRGLAAKGATVLGPVNSLGPALALIEEDEVDLAVLDINVKGQLVFPLADELRRRAVPFVFTTGYGSEMIPAQFQNIARWEKPFALDGLVRSLAGLCT